MENQSLVYNAMRNKIMLMADLKFAYSSATNYELVIGF